VRLLQAQSLVVTRAKEQWLALKASSRARWPREDGRVCKSGLLETSSDVRPWHHL